MPKRKKTNRDPVQVKLDRIIDLLEDLLVVQSRRAGVGWTGLRKIAKIDAKRVSSITKHMKGKD